jgi:hypothetical protein
MRVSQPETAGQRAIRQQAEREAKAPTAARKTKGEKANRRSEANPIGSKATEDAAFSPPSKARNPAKDREGAAISAAATQIARLLVAGMADRAMADAQAGLLWPNIVQATMDTALGYSPAAMTARVQLLRWAGHPSATAQDAQKAARQAGASLAERLASRLSVAELGSARQEIGTATRPIIEEPPFPAPIARKRTR